MNCAICGKDNQPGTRFCVHCGASLAATAPAPGGAVPRPAPAATGNAAASSAPPPSRQGPASAAEPTVIRKAATVAAAPIPAYNAEPRKGGGRVLLIIGIAALVIAGGYLGYKIFGGSADVKDSLARFETPPAARIEPPVKSPPPPPAMEPAPAPAPPEAPKPADETSSIAKEGEAATPAKPIEAPKAVSPGAAKVDGKSEGKAAAKSPPVGTTSPATTPAPTPRPAAPAAAIAVPPPAAAPVQDRWAKFDEELLECKKESLFNRIVCDQKVRLRYCNGYWGKVAQCPGNPTNADKGQ